MSPTTSAPRLLRLAGVRELTGLSRSGIYRDATLCRARVKIGRRAAAWREDYVQAWVNARCAEAAR